MQQLTRIVCQKEMYVDHQIGRANEVEEEVGTEIGEKKDRLPPSKRGKGP